MRSPAALAAALLSLLAACGGGGAKVREAPAGGGGGGGGGGGPGVGVGGDGTFTLGTGEVAPFPWERTDGPAVWADFDGDGRADFARAVRAEDPRVVFAPEWTGAAIFFGAGDGTFFSVTQAPLPQLATRFGFLHLRAGDFDGDGDLDLAFVHGGDVESTMTAIGATWRCRAAVLANQGARVFAFLPTADLAGAPSTGVADVAAADVDGDGADDLVTTEPVLFAAFSGGAPDGAGLQVRLADGAGGFAATEQGLLPSFLPVRRVRTGDFDGDGATDLLATSLEFGAPGVEPRTTATFWGGFGDGRMAWAGETGLGPAPADVLVGDVDGDGSSDLVVPSHDGALVVLLGRPDGLPEPHLAGIAYAGVLFAHALGDFDGDGRDDHVSLGIGLGVSPAQGFWVRLAAADGSLLPANPAFYATATGAVETAVVDVNGDGALDAVFFDADTGAPVPLYGNPD